MKAIITGGGSEETIPRCPYLMLKQNKAKEGERWHPNCARWMWVNALCVFSKGSGERQGVEPRQCAESERNYDQSERRGTSPNAGGMGLSQLCRQVGLEQSGLGRGAPGVQLLWVAPASQFPRSAQRQLPFSPPAEKQTPRPRYSKEGRVCQPPTASSSSLREVAGSMTSDVKVTKPFAPFSQSASLPGLPGLPKESQEQDISRITPLKSWTLQATSSSHCGDMHAQLPPNMTSNI